MTDKRSEQVTNGQVPRESDPLLVPKSDETTESPSDEGEGGVVETVLEAISEGIEAIAESAVAVKENAEDLGADLRDEMQEVAGAFVDELEEADDGNNYFLDMSLARNLSILPTDVQNAAADETLEASIEAIESQEKRDEELQLTTVQKEKAPEPVATPVSAYLMLASAVITLSSIGPLLDLQKGCSPAMKIYWRMSATAMFLLPMAGYQIRKDGLPRLSCPEWTTFAFAAASYATICVGFVMALLYTSVGNAVILANSQAIILLIGKFLVGERVLPMESSGAITAFIGAVFCSKDSADSKPTKVDITGEEIQNLTWLGDLFAFTSGMGGVGYLVLAKKVRANMGLYTFMFLIMALGSTMVLLFQMIVLGEDVEFSRDPRIGTWGWMSPLADRLPLEITMVIICNLVGSLGYIRAMQYFDNLIISVAALMEPVVAEFMAFSFGVGFLPGWKGWLGNALVVAGTLAVIAPSARSGKSASH